MENENRFWTHFWIIMGTILVSVIVVISFEIHVYNSLWYDSWNKCIERGGEPKQVAIIGSNELTFTCDLPQ